MKIKLHLFQIFYSMSSLLQTKKWNKSVAQIIKNVKKCYKVGESG